ncbi:aminotransferase class III-fold pyridoxal phosphate-dependent enzyme [Albimonas sp. CAU 1670]|uniref:aminotransferase class III-fold pyridoxal phosphate-dependent enzyme n=1 Tax=Albimonas sp. CAU 1670 TaxID=3032599 RepID=UPI0023D9C254|nr:aminotransferase class III-fold pyridoxal phosphate-dependent enzyme [Albimonas sp. CAU 1670]MDF2231754.1 aminotransferase class III-fold pyridoxal phosphate-dependent enzyme [Albimonas sp. CAU 1670]
MTTPSATMDRDLRDRAARVIPNGMYGHMATTLSPPGAPQFYARAQGTRLWDVDGREYVDLLSAYGPNLLGYGEPRVLAAAKAQMDLCDASTGPTALLVELAEAMVAQVAAADWAMFCKNGSDATGMAVMMARAHTGRRRILTARNTYHGAQPWCTPRPAGVLPEDRAHVRHFDYNDPESLEAAVQEAGDDLAAIMVTPHRHETFQDQHDAEAAFARRLRELADEAGALLIMDEVRTGFRLAAGGSWEGLGVAPDIACWGKVLGNGQPISAVTGAERVREAAGSIYVTGSFWFAGAPMAAAIETLRQIAEGGYLARMRAAGARLREGLGEQADRHGFGLVQSGPTVMPLFRFEEDAELRRIYRFCDVAIANGALLSPYHNMFTNAAMTEADVDRVLEATEAAFLDLRARNADLPPVPAPVAARLAAAASAPRG